MATLATVATLTTGLCLSCGFSCGALVGPRRVRTQEKQRLSAEIPDMASNCRSSKPPGGLVLWFPAAVPGVRLDSFAAPGLFLSCGWAP